MQYKEYKLTTAVAHLINKYYQHNYAVCTAITLLVVSNDSVDKQPIMSRIQPDNSHQNASNMNFSTYLMNAYTLQILF